MNFHVLPFQISFLWKKNTLSESVDKNQTACSVQSDLDLHCPQKRFWVAKTNSVLFNTFILISLQTNALLKVRP